MIDLENLSVMELLELQDKEKTITFDEWRDRLFAIRDILEKKKLDELFKETNINFETIFHNKYTESQTTFKKYLEEWSNNCISIRDSLKKDYDKEAVRQLIMFFECWKPLSMWQQNDWNKVGGVVTLSRFF
jgi:hypothetical protein